MTTTLRPTGPEQYDVDGVRSRSYDICLNSRPVGGLRLATDPRYGPTIGRLEQLAVDEGERRRGRGAVAVLTAEEILRDWGCRSVELSVAAGAQPALKLTESLGYLERSRAMLKELGEEPSLPPGSTARPMTEEDFPVWRERGKPSLVRMLTERGIPADQIERRAEESTLALLPEGVATRGAVLRVLVHEGADVGTVWIDVERSPRTDADSYVYEVEVDEDRRGLGHGRTLMLIAERECLAAGAHVLGLNVYAHNTPALRLYSSLGYRTAELHLYKRLL
jgi:ribosomal protein S18 acetylase RimI-like enzyme